MQKVSATHSVLIAHQESLPQAFDHGCVATARLDSIHRCRRGPCALTATPVNTQPLKKRPGVVSVQPASSRRLMVPCSVKTASQGSTRRLRAAIHAANVPLANLFRPQAPGRATIALSGCMPRTLALHSALLAWQGRLWLLHPKAARLQPTAGTACQAGMHPSPLRYRARFVWLASLRTTVRLPIAPIAHKASMPMVTAR